MSRARRTALLLGAFLSLFATYAAASLNLSLTVGSAPSTFCFGNPTDNFWDFTPTVSAGDTGPMFFTIYDIGVACTVEPLSFPLWKDTNQLSGTTPAGVSLTDDPTINNVTFSCAQTSNNCQSGVAVNVIVLRFATGCFAYSWQDDSAAGAPQSGTGTICAPGTPSVPEPATLALLGIGFAGLAATRRRKPNSQFHNPTMRGIAMKALAVVVSAAAVALCLVTSSATAADAGPPGGINVNVVNTPSNPVPVTVQGGSVSGNVAITNTPNVNVVNTPTMLTGIPPGQFSTLITGNTGLTLISGIDPPGTNYAVTSITFVNSSATTKNLGIDAEWGNVSASCQGFSGGLGNTTFGPNAIIPPHATVHLAYPQPFVFLAKSGANACLGLLANDLEVDVVVIGYKF